MHSEDFIPHLTAVHTTCGELSACMILYVNYAGIQGQHGYSSTVRRMESFARTFSDGVTSSAARGCRRTFAISICLLHLGAAVEGSKVP